MRRERKGWGDLLTTELTICGFFHIRACVTVTRKHIYTRYLTFKSINSFIVKINLITLAFYTLNTRKHSVHIKVLLVKSHFICYIFKSICPPVLGLSYVVTSPNTLHLHLMDRFSLFLYWQLHPYQFMKNAAYTLSSRMITLTFKHFQRLFERGPLQKTHTHGKKHGLLTQPFSVGSRDYFTHGDEMDFVHRYY